MVKSLLKILLVVLFVQYLNFVGIAQIPVHVQVYYGIDAGECSWNIWANSDSSILLSDNGSAINNAFSYNDTIYLLPGDYTFNAFDSYGDGWNGGGWYEISPLFGTSTSQVFFQNGGVQNTGFTVYPLTIIDMGIVDLNSPVSGISLDSNEIVSVKIKNFGLATQSNFTISYSIDNGISFITETCNQNIEFGEDYVFSFLQNADFSNYGLYNCIIAIHANGDSNILNDTIAFEISNYEVVSNFPWTENFDNGISFGWQNEGVENWIENNSYVYCDFWNWSNSENAILISPPFEINNTSILSFDWSSYNFSAYDLSEFNIYISTDTCNSWQLIWEKSGEELNSNDGATNTLPGNFVNEIIDLSNYLNNVIHIKFEGVSGWGPNLFLDNISVQEITQVDLSIEEILLPQSGCGLSNQEEISILVKNNSLFEVSNFEVSFSLDNGNTFITEIILDTIAAEDSLIYNFNQTIDISSTGQYQLITNVSYLFDMNSENNSFQDSIISVETLNFTGLNSGFGLTPVYVQVFYNGNWPYENSWEIINEFGDTIIFSTTGNNITNDFSFNDTIYLPVGNYTFIAHDLYGDGWGGVNSQSWYEITTSFGSSTGYQTFTQGVIQTSSFSIGGSIPFCQNSVALTLTGNLQSAIFSGDGISGNIFDPLLAGLGVHTIYYSYNNNEVSCIDSQSVEIFEAPILELGSNQDLCDGENLILNAGNSDYYVWSNGATDQSISVNSSGTYSVTVSLENNCTATDQIEVEFFNIPNLDLGNDQEICEGDTFILDAGEELLYSWNTGSNSQFINILQGGTYSVTVSDSLNCENADTINIIVNSIPNLFIGNDINICGNDTIIINADSAFSYLWNTGSTNQSIIVSESGNYSVIITDSNYCQNSDEINISINPIPVLSLGNDTSICDNESLLISIDGYNNYLWSSGNTNQSIEIIQTGNYSLTVTDINSCLASDSIIVTFVFAPIVDLGPDLNYCENEICNLTANAGDSFLWSTNSTNQSIVVNQTGNYSVIVTNNNGCSATDDINVVFNPLPIIDLGENQTICDGDSVILDLGQFSHYIWTNNTWTDTNQTISVFSSDHIYVSVIDNNNCIASDEIEINVQDLPIIELGSDIFLCDGDTAILNGGNTENYYWNTGETSQEIQATSSGIFSVVVSDSLACESSDSINVFFYSIPIIELGENQLICNLSSYQIDAGNFSSYLWNDGSLAQSINITQNGLYSVIVTDSNNCQNSDSIYVTFGQSPIVNLGADQTICEEDSIILDAGNGYTYLWNNSNSSQIIEISQTGIYSVTITDSIGCEASDTISIVVNNSPFIDLGADQGACQGTAINLDAGLFDAYLWNNGQTSQTITVFFSGDYSVTVTNSNGCQASDNVNITINPYPSIELGQNQIGCEGSSVTLDPGGNAYLLYWSTGIIAPTLDVYEAGLYSVIATDMYGCMATDFVYVSFVSPPVVDLGLNQTICDGTSIVIDAGNFNSYLWNTGETSDTLEVFLAGDYYVSVTDNNGCTGVDTFSLSLYPSPVVDLGVDLTIDTNQSIILDAGYGFTSYLWNNSSINQTINVDGAFLPIGSYSYSVSVTNSYGCSAFDSINVSVGIPVASQTIVLPQGWSMFSTYINPNFPNISDVLSTISSEIVLVKSDLGLLFWPYYGINQIGDLTIGKAYLLKVNISQTFIVEGMALVPENTALNLPQGWSMLGYLRQSTAPIADMLSSIENSIYLVKNSMGLLYWPQYGINTMGTMVPGEGYQINLFNSEIFSYPANVQILNKNTKLNIKNNQLFKENMEDITIFDEIYTKELKILIKNFN